MKILKNYIYQFLYQLLNLLVPLITLPYVTKKLGAQNYGIYVYSFTIISYITLFTDFGLRVYGNRKISYLRDDLQNKTNAFWNIFFTKLILTLIVLVLTVVIFYLADLPMIYWLQLLGLLISIFDISWFYQGIEKFKEIALRNVVVKIIFIILLPEIAIKLYTSIDRIMLGYFLLKQDVSYYDIANKFLIIIMIGITTFGNVMLPKISNLFYTNKENEIKKLLRLVLNYYLMFSIPLIFGILATSKELVLKFLGEEYLEVVPVINLMSFTIIFWTINNVTGNQILIPMNKERILTKSVFNFLLNLFLIKKIGIIGVVVATFLTEAIVTGIQVYFTKEYLKFDFLKVIKYTLSSIIMFAFIQIIPLLYLKILLGVVLYLFMMIILREINLKEIKSYIRK